MSQNHVGDMPIAFWKPFSAIMAAMVLLGLSDNLVVMVSDDIGLWQLHAVRGFFCIIVTLAWMRVYQIKLVIQNRNAVAWRTFFITISMLLFFGALPFVGVAIAGAGLFTAPIFVLLFGLVLFGESVGPRRIAAVILGSIGVVLVLNIGAPNFTYFAVFSVMAGAFYAATNIITRRYCADERTLVLLLCYVVAITSAGILIASFNSLFFDQGSLTGDSAYLMRGWAVLSLENTAIMAFQGLVTVIALALITWSYQTSETATIAILEYSYLIFGGFFGWLFWSDQLSLSSFVGIFAIVGAGAIITLRHKATT